MQEFERDVFRRMEVDIPEETPSSSRINISVNIISDLRQLLFQKVFISEIQDILDCVQMALQDYDIVKKERSLVVYNDYDKEIIGRYFVAKTVENLSPKSLDSYRIVLKAFLLAANKKISDITTDDVRVYILKKKMDGISDSYVNTIRRYLNSFFSWIQAEGLIESNPVARIKSVKEEKKVRLPFTEDELELLRAACHTDRDNLIVEFLYSTGCRVSEMLSVRRAEIDFNKCRVNVVGKGRKHRTVYISSRCKMVLHKYLESRTDNHPSLFVSDAVGFGRSGELHTLTDSGVRAVLKRLGLTAGINNVHPHRFRRTAATMALQRGMPIEQVQKMLGHTSIQTTTIYAEAASDEVMNSHKKCII